MFGDDEYGQWCEDVGRDRHDHAAHIAERDNGRAEAATLPGSRLAVLCGQFGHVFGMPVAHNDPAAAGPTAQVTARRCLCCNVVRFEDVAWLS